MSGQTALSALEKALGPDHPWTKDFARVTADALDELDRADQAAAMRGQYGIEHDGREESSTWISRAVNNELVAVKGEAVLIAS